MIAAVQSIAVKGMSGAGHHENISLANLVLPFVGLCAHVEFIAHVENSMKFFDRI
jgi:hypothetical protein